MSEEKKFKSGDVVVLKSGGPWMTVTRTVDAPEVTCVWFVEADLTKTHNGRFDAAWLYSEDEFEEVEDDDEDDEDLDA